MSVSHSVAPTLAERLKSRRKRDGKTQKEFAERLEVNLRTYEGWERGGRAPTGARLAKILALLADGIEIVLKEIKQPSFYDCMTLKEQEERKKKAFLNAEEDVKFLQANLPRNYFGGEAERRRVERALRRRGVIQFLKDWERSLKRREKELTARERALAK